MKKVVLFLILIVSKNLVTAQESFKKDERYIQTYARLAVEEMERYKIPASITLAQGILETGNGQSDLAQFGNNHFGIKCKDEWLGERMYHDDDLKGECFRKYSSADESYRDHSRFLAERPYYKKLFLLDSKDYKAWAHGLKKSGYATNPKYAYTLINLIERYRLNEFDSVTSEDVYVKLAQLYPDSYKIPQENKPETLFASTKSEEIEGTSPSTVFVSYNPEKPQVPVRKTISKPTNNFEFPSLRIRFHPNGNIKFIVVREGDTLENIAKAYNISIDKLRRYNDLISRKELKTNQKIFLEPKKKSGKIKEYVTREGDNMYDISQNNGVSLYELYKKNLMIPGQEPKKGDVILLKVKKS